MSEDKTRVVVRMPALGDGVFEGVVRFLKPPGAQVQRDEPVAEVETDKVSIELVAPESGTIESLAVADLAVVPVDGPLYVLRPGGVAAPGPAPVLAAAPELAAVTLRWDAAHVRARARGLGEPLAAEAALIVTALLRALAAVPALLRRDREVHTSWVDVDGVAARWVCGALAVDLPVTGALAWTRVSQPAEPPNWRPTLRVLRLHDRVARSARWGGYTPLQVTIGPVHDEPAVVSGVVVVRPLATITVEANAGADALLRFVAALAEQLGQV